MDIFADRMLLAIWAGMCFLGGMSVLVYSAEKVRCHNHVRERMAEQQRVRREAEDRERRRREIEDAKQDVKVVEGG